ncbi:MAG: cytochrome c3 family protein [Desulfobacteraceae bacterium]|nr:cytochrome c3 family protein [Desulfobacteraceae bacterium]MBC2718331.1 cytochrome c3 family protein [Desulfobacteraceae bacterium]
MNNIKTIFLCLVILMLLVSGVSYAGTYLESAHGNSTHGVNRKSTLQYATGHCAHCHEQHASIDGTEPEPNTGDAAGPDKFCLLANNFDTSAIPGAYVQDDNACFYCHYGTGTFQGTPFSNYSYSVTFGGNTDTTTATIFDAFNLTSYHNLKDVIDYAAATWTTTFTTDNNPCCTCHNTHLAKRNKANPDNPVYTAISKPSAHDELWGDDDTERMDDYPLTYQAPYYYAVTPTSYEPANNATSDGSNLPNYAAFCLDCHVNDIDGAGPLSAIDWAFEDQHGQGDATAVSSEGSLIAPYADASSGNYALSCTDCHEPHGSSNKWLLRTEVNAKSGISITTGVWYEFCTACHIVDLISGNHSSLNTGSTCNDAGCHSHGSNF